MKPVKKTSKSQTFSRRGFIAQIPMAAAALTLSSSFGFPVTTAQGDGRLYLKVEGIAGESRMSRDGIYQFSLTEIEKLKTGNFPSLNIKWSLSTDKQNWQTMTAKITDTTTIRQLSDMAKKI
jgi:hypothetical protein